jgi:DNA invertase Pin-like site-specific DNA recombinase
MRIGYARVSTTALDLDLQRDALKRAGCDKIIEDTVSGDKVETHWLGSRARTAPGDVLAVWRLVQPAVFAATACPLPDRGPESNVHHSS